jgi:hypothetical protein
MYFALSGVSEHSRKREGQARLFKTFGFGQQQHQSCTTPFVLLLYYLTSQGPVHMPGFLMFLYLFETFTLHIAQSSTLEIEKEEVY